MCIVPCSHLVFVDAFFRSSCADEQAVLKTARFGPFFCAFLTANAPLISPKLCGPPTGLTNVFDYVDLDFMLRWQMGFACALGSVILPEFYPPHPHPGFNPLRLRLRLRRGWVVSG
jgi:hypothetical protein